MKFWRQIEDKNELDSTLQNVEKRASLSTELTVKQSLKLIIRGMFFSITLMAFDYARRNPEVEGILRTLFTIGFIGSIIGVLLIPYGLYNLIKSWTIKRT